MKYYRYIIIMVLISLCLCRQATAGWQMEIIDPFEPFTFSASLAFDASGSPAIAANESRFARFNGTSWDITTFDPGRFKSVNTSLAFDVTGNPAVAYTILNFDIPVIRTNIRYAHFNGTTWDITTIGGIIDKRPDTVPISLAFDATGNPTIAYNGGISLNFAQFDGATWNITTVESGVSVGLVSLAFDATGNPAISYDNFQQEVKFARFNGATWDITTIDPAPSSSPSLAFDATGNPAIAYGSGSGIKFARFNGATWDITTIDPAPSGRPSLAFDATGNPAIAYDSGSGLKFARFNGVAWEITTVDSEEISRIRVVLTDGNESLALDPLGNPAIAYRAGADGDLKFARFVPNTPTTVSGVVTSLAGQSATASVMKNFADTSPAEGKTVILRKRVPFGWKKIKTTVTGENSSYAFTNLEDGRYRIKVRECIGKGSKKTFIVRGGGMVSDKNFQCR